MFLSIVCYLDEESTVLIRNYQKALSELTGSIACLTEWLPHVTVGDGIAVSEEELKYLFTGMDSLAGKFNCFKVRSKDTYTREDRTGGVNEITTPYCLGLNIAESDELFRLVDELADFTSNYSMWYKMPYPYSPHTTLAFKDLNKAGYHAGKEYINNNPISFSTTIASFSVVEKQPNQDLELRRFDLS